MESVCVHCLNGLIYLRGHPPSNFSAQPQELPHSPAHTREAVAVDELPYPYPTTATPLCSARAPHPSAIPRRLEKVQYD
jgi:hypothetical protein